MTLRHFCFYYEYHGREKYKWEQRNWFMSSHKVVGNNKTLQILFKTSSFINRDATTITTSLKKWPMQCQKQMQSKMSQILFFNPHLL